MIVAATLLGSALADDNASLLREGSWLVPLLVLAGFCSWFEIRMELYGALNLSPVVFLVVSYAYGLSSGVLVATLAPLSGMVIRRLLGSPRLDLTAALAEGGEAALSLKLGALFSIWQRQDPWDLLRLSATTMFVLLALMVLRVALSEGIAVARLLRPLASRALPHLAAMFLAVPLISLAFSVLGPLGLVLSVIVMVETYDPWRLLGDQRDLFLRSLQMMSNAVDLKDPYTAHHSKRVSDYSVKLARTLGVREEEVVRIRIGALMHDIGKIAVPGNIIRKPSRLTDSEMDVMKNHVQAGASLIEGLEILEDSREIVLHHHENYDGTGYPSGLSADQIPIGSRIVFVADAYDALTTDRPYRKGKTRSEALDVIVANARNQFDPRVVEALKGLRDLQG